MKIKNLAFFGIMASILSIGGAHADGTGTTPTATVIASQAYVDAKETTTKAYADTQAGAAKTYADTQDATTLQSAKDYAEDQDETTLASAQSYTDDKINAMDATAGTAANASATAITAFSQTNGVISVEQGTLTSAAISDRISAKADVKTGETKLVTAGAVADVVKDAVDSATEAVTKLDVTTADNGNASDGVVKYVTQTDGKVSVTKAKITTSDIADNAAITGSQLAASAGITGSQLASNAGITGTQLANNTITANQIATGAVGSDEIATDAVDSDEIKAGAVTYAKIADGAKVTTSNIDGDKTLTAVPTATQDSTFPTVGAVIKHVEKTTGDAINSLDVGEKAGVIMKIKQDNGKIDATVGTIKNENVDAAAAIAYTKMDSASLAEINGQTGFAAGTNCTTANPCILSYAGPTDGYKWTQMVFPTTTPTTPGN